MKKRLYFLLFLFHLSAAGIAQQMQMDGMPKTYKNIFLAIMDTMMHKMDGISPKQSVEGEFINQMIPHHEGAISMAQYEIQHGKNFRMIQLAKSIVAEQSNEVAQMNLWIHQHFVDSINVTNAFRQDMEKTMTTMMSGMPTNKMLITTDRAFVLTMIPHHQAAIDMAKVVLNYSTNAQTAAYAQHIIGAQEIEIEQMRDFLKK